MSLDKEYDYYGVKIPTAYTEQDIIEELEDILRDWNSNLPKELMEWWCNYLDGVKA